MIDEGIDEVIRNYFFLRWLRPEDVAWDIAAYVLLSPILREKNSTVFEIGVGNGYNSFMLLGGRFDPSFDWYHGVDLSDFWKNRDIYASTAVDVGDYIRVAPEKRLSGCMDASEGLIEKARGLEIAEHYQVGDANSELQFGPVDVIYTNILYWLTDPRAVVSHVFALLQPGGRFVCVFSNELFTQYCRSLSAGHGLVDAGESGQG